MNLQIIILAAGQGKRMYSDLPKVLHPIAGTPMLERVVQAAQALKPQAVHVIYGHGGEQIKKALPDLPVQWILQEQQLGTGHAIMQALPHLPRSSQVLILSGDVPLIHADTLRKLLAQHQEPGLTLLTADLDNPFGLGRILRNEHEKIQAIIEEKDASAEQKAIREIYSGICVANTDDLARWLPNLNNDNAQGEYYLTEIIRVAVAEHTPVYSLKISDVMQIQGVNNRQQLQELERIWQQRCAEKLMEQGVGLADANRIDIRGSLTCGKDVFIDVNCVFIGTVVLGDRTIIGPNSVIIDSRIGQDCEIYSHSVVEGSVLDSACHVGPFARLRPGTRLAPQCKIGNFVEAKKAVFDEGSKASHLSYLGDVTIGKKVNIGAGTITCNYDGVNKHQTIIEDGAFIGSDTQLVAPVTVGKDATIGAGSTIRKDAPAGELTLTESRQKTVFGWKRPVKQS